ncbi:uncharacterized protein FOMMEDRAFT_150929 [Fomitiporia mediterranea MF3/22]|uniref:uncharacterized protein n=1 Tax=Fomitiporia mediterranea (strain MF3/22) TaxID=694068 RepID=UPI0004407AB9|nr:uncharacterized protein FOMMEDRAFT_150929 [Fomitiporia mediterranea MF3/22]EJD08210.1 hypothetical protein FOMMEDRAFT_150929 [Fomitiporia mediterranea MF3/22]
MKPLKKSLLKAGAEPVMPNNADSDNSLASLYLIAWKARDPGGVFHKFPITRDDDANRVPLSLPDSVTALSWTVEGSTPDILEANFQCTAVYIREEYTVMLSALLKALHKSGGDAFGYDRIDAKAFQDKFPPVNPFEKMQVQKVTACKAPCIVVTRTPGIGKSLFLYYILALRLLAQKSTVLLYKQGYCLIFHECGQRRRLSPTSFPRGECRTTPRLIVVATSPRIERMTFNKDPNSPRLWMHPFKEKELYEAMGMQLRRLKEIQLRAFFDKFGPVAREAFQFSRNLDGYENIILFELGFTSLESLQHRIGQVVYGHSDSGLSHKMLATYPTDDSDHTDFNVAIPTKKLADLVFSRLMVHNMQEARTVCSIFLRFQKSRAVASYLLEPFTLKVLPDGDQWREGDPDAPVSETFDLVGYQYLEKDRPPPQEVGFYVPTAASQPTFDAVARVNDAANPFVIFQMTCDKSHKINSIGLNWVGQGKVDIIVVTSWDGGEDIESRRPR